MVSNTYELTNTERKLASKLGIKEHELVGYKEVFRLVDKDGGGTISKDELEVLMKTLGIQASKAELVVMVNEISNEEEINFEAFATAMARKVSTIWSHAQLASAFQLHDSSGYERPSGRVTYEYLLTLLTEMGTVDKRMRLEDAEELLVQVAPHAVRDRYLDYNSYLSILFSD